MKASGCIKYAGFEGKDAEVFAEEIAKGKTPQSGAEAYLESLNKKMTELHESVALQGYKIPSENGTVAEGKAPAPAPSKMKPVDILSKAFKRWFGKSKVVDSDGKPLRVYHGTTADDFSEFSVGEIVQPEEDSIYYTTGSGADPRTFLGSHFAEESSVANKFAKGLYGEREGVGDKGRVYPVYLQIENPYETSDSKMMSEMLEGNYSSHMVEFAIEDYAYENSMEVDALNTKYDGDVDFRKEINERALALEAENNEGEFHLSNEMAEVYQQKLKEKGHDGVKYTNEVEGGTSYIAFEPTQIKSAISNTGEFSDTDGNISMSRGTEALPEGSTVKEVQAEVDKTSGKWVVQPIVVKDTNKLPAHLRTFLGKTQSLQTARGVYDPDTKKAYLIASNIDPGTNIRGLVLHEVVGHYGFLRVLQAGGLHMRDMAKTIKRMRSAGNKTILSATAEVRRRYTNKNKDGVMEYLLDDEQEAKEVIAIMAEGGVKSNLLTRVIAAIRKGIRILTGNTSAEINEADIRAMLVQAQEVARTGRVPTPGFITKKMLDQRGMVAFHGTPHRFKPTKDNPLGEFDLTKMGSGEGAQAFGWGCVPCWRRRNWKVLSGCVVGLPDGV